MLYTVGYTDYYEKYFKEQVRPSKQGQGVDHNGKPYTGGCIWLTRDDAEAYLKSTGQSLYSVYGVECDIQDTEKVEGQPFRNLLKTSPLFKLDAVTA